MNIYDTANKLAQELRQSEEYVNYKMAKETLKLKPDLKKKIDEFEMARYEAQIAVMQTGKNDEEKTKKVQQLYVELYDDADAVRFFDTELKFNTILADVDKIIGDAVMDVIK